MIRYVLRRLALAVPTLFGIAVVVFLLVHLAPGSPVAGSDSSLRRTTGRAAEEMRRLYGLDRPLPERFGAWLSRAARFDLGESFVDHRPVSLRIREALPNTLLLNGLALVLALAIAIPLGVVAGARPEGAFDRLSGAVLFALYSMPTFWAALLLQTLFAVRLRWLPLYGVASDAAPGGPRGSPGPPGARRAAGHVPRLRNARLRRAPGALGSRRGPRERLRPGVSGARGLAAPGDLGPRLPQRRCCR